MNEDDYGALLRYARAVVRRSGRTDLDERAFSSRLRDVPDTAGAAIAYLSAVRDEVSLGTEQNAREAMRRFRGVRTESGEPVSGITVDVSAEDAQALGTESVRLVGSPRLDEVVAELDELIRSLEDDRLER